MTWKLKALADPELKHKDWMLLKVGPTTLGDMFKYQIMKIRYMISD